MDFSVQDEKRGDVAVVRPVGEVDIYTAPRLKEHILNTLEQGDARLVVDLSSVDFMDSSGLGVLVSALKRTKDLDGELRIVCPKGGVLKIFSITGLTKVFGIDATLEEALGGMSG